VTEPTLPPGVPVRNAEVAWDRWPVQTYLAENYRQVHPADAAVIAHHGAFYRDLAPDSVPLALELGAGPNLYPLFLAASCSRRIHAVEPSAANLAYLRGQLAGGPDPSWRAFHAACRRAVPSVPDSPVEALARVEVVTGDASTVEPGRYDLASMHFMAESVTESEEEFRDLCRRFVGAVRPGGLLVAAFMENLGRFEMAGRQWPSFPVDAAGVVAAFAGEVVDLAVSRIDDDPSLPAWGYTGMVLLTARRADDR
jgi:hypothetical protein